jgi:hypothetical protein
VLGAGALVAIAAWLLTTVWAQHVTDASHASDLLRFDDRPPRRTRLRGGVSSAGHVLRAGGDSRVQEVS